MRYALKVRPQLGLSYARILEMAQAAEAAGFEAFFRSDHWRPMSGPDLPSTDAWTTLAGLARETRTIRLGTLVSPIAFRGPYELAKVVATVDEMSGGRVELGIGAGWLEREHEPLGLTLGPIGERFDRLTEQLEIVTSLWTQPSTTFEGRWYTLRDAALEPKPVQRPHPPIVLGGTGKPRGLALAVKYGAEYDFDDLAPEAIAPLVPRLRDACVAAGRDPGTLVVSAMTDWPAGDVAAKLARAAAFAAVGVERIILDTLAGVDPDEVLRFGREVNAGPS